MKRLYIILIVLLFVILTILFSGIHTRWDFTFDKRHTLSQTTSKILGDINKPIQIKVYLEGDFPSYFKKLSGETRQLLEQFSKINNNIEFELINPLENQLADKLKEKGMEPAEVTIQKSGELTSVMIFPWAEIIYEDKTEQLPLLVSAPGLPIEEQINKSISNLEYAFVNRISKLTRKEKPKIAVLKGNGEWPDIFIADLLMSLREFYRLAPFTLDSLQTQPQQTLQDLLQFNMLLIAGPTEAFTDEEKFALDQFLMHGGSMLIAVDPVKAYKDTLMYKGKTYALNAELNLTDWLFGYGVRLRPVLVKDLMAAPVTLKVGEVAGNPQLEQFPWFYSPLVRPNSSHPIGEQTGEVKLDFVSVVDTLKHGPVKTVLLESSPYTQVVGVPLQINFDEIAKQPDEQQYRNGKQIFGVLLEGKFTSAYKDRVKPLENVPFKEQSQTKMILIADGDILKNDVTKNQPFPLGYDKWSRLQFDNKTFILNAIRYLTDDEGIFMLKNKKITLTLLDKNKFISASNRWRMMSFTVPLLFLLLLFAGIGFWRKRKYTI